MVSWRSRGGIGPCGEAPGKGSRSSASECEVECKARCSPLLPRVSRPSTSDRRRDIISRQQSGLLCNMASWMSDMALASSPALPRSRLCLAAAFPGGDVVCVEQPSSRSAGVCRAPDYSSWAAQSEKLGNIPEEPEEIPSR